METGLVLYSLTLKGQKAKLTLVEFELNIVEIEQMSQYNVSVALLTTNPSCYTPLRVCVDGGGL